MCVQCNKTDGYVQAVQNAISVQKNTGIEQAIFIKNGISYFGNRESVAKESGICCYILTTGEEIKIEVSEPIEEKTTPIEPTSENNDGTDELLETIKSIEQNALKSAEDAEEKEVKKGKKK